MIKGQNTRRQFAGFFDSRINEVVEFQSQQTRRLSVQGGEGQSDMHNCPFLAKTGKTDYDEGTHGSEHHISEITSPADNTLCPMKRESLCFITGELCQYSSALNCRDYQEYRRMRC